MSVLINADVFTICKDGTWYTSPILVNIVCESSSKKFNLAASSISLPKYAILSDTLTTHPSQVKG